MTRPMPDPGLQPNGQSPDGARLQLLNGFALYGPSHEIRVPLPGQRVLALLAVMRRGMRRDSVAATLWPDATSACGAASLRSSLWRLPRVNDRPLIDATPTSLRLSAQVTVDVVAAEHQLRRMLASGTAPGNDLDGACGADADPPADLLPDWWDEWLLVERERFRQLRLHALDAVSSAYRAVGRFDRAVDAALHAVAAEPLRESSNVRVIEAHLDEGNRVEALRHYDSYRLRLRHETGLSPSPRLRALVAPLLAVSPSH